MGVGVDVLRMVGWGKGFVFLWVFFVGVGLVGECV